MLRYPESVLKSFGNYSCYFLSIMKLAEDFTGSNFDIFTIITICSSHYGANGKPWITFNWDNPNDKANFDVNHPDKVFELLTGIKWSVTKEPVTYKPKHGELVVECWKNGNTTHFRLKDWDPIKDSITVKEGKLDSFRVFRRV